jgi:hypothetical protein
MADQARLPGLESQIQLERLKAAIDSYRECRQTKEKSREVCQQIDAELANLTRAYAKLTLTQIDRTAPRTVPEHSQVVAELERAVNYDDPNRILRKALDEHRNRKEKLTAQVQDLLGKAAEKRSARNWQEAISALDEAIAIDPPNKEAGRLRQQVLSERDDHYARAIRELCRDATFERCLEADTLFRRFDAEKPHPDNSLVGELRGLIDRIRRQVAEQLIGQKKYFSAYVLVKDTSTPECASLLTTTISQGGAFYMAVAAQEYRNVREFHAYAAAVKAMELLGPDNEHASKLHRDCADRVDDSIQIKIGTAPFKSSGDEPDIGKRITNDLMSQLHPLLPYGVQIEEREKIAFTIEQKGSTDAVQILELKLAAFGDAECKIQREHNARQMSVWTPVLKTIANPQYEIELKRMAEAGKNRDKLPPPQPTITVKVSEKVEYTVGEDLLHGQLACSVRIYSTGAGYVTNPRSFTISREAKDTFCDGVPEANIPRDPLELPSQMTFLQGMREEMVKQISDWLVGQFNNRQRQFCEQTEYRIQRREWDLATKEAIQGYFYCLRAKVPKDDTWFVRLHKLALLDLTEGSPRTESTEPSPRPSQR